MFRTPTSDAAAGAEGEARNSEKGFTLAALIVILTVISIIVAYTVPDQWSLVMQRERERHTIWTMKQYARAIMTFHQKHKVLPTSLKQLHEARQPRVVRGEEERICLLTGKADWILVPPQAITMGGAPLPGGQLVEGGAPSVPTTTILQGRGAIVVPVTDPRAMGAPGAAGQAGQYSKLNPELSPPDYKEGPFVGVRPRKTGKSMLALNEAEDYGQWVYTYQDVYNDVAMRISSLYKQ